MVRTPQRLLARAARRRAELERARRQQPGGGEAGQHVADAPPSALSPDPAVAPWQGRRSKSGGPARRSRTPVYPSSSELSVGGGAPLLGTVRHRLAALVGFVRALGLARRRPPMSPERERFLRWLACEESEGVSDRAAAEDGLLAPPALRDALLADADAVLLDLERDLDLGGGVDHAR